jgi:hypothetical protein
VKQLQIERQMHELLAWLINKLYSFFFCLGQYPVTGSSPLIDNSPLIYNSKEKKSRL